VNPPFLTPLIKGGGGDLEGEGGFGRREKMDMSARSRFIVLFLLAAVLCCYAEEQTADLTGGKTDTTSVVAKITEMEARLDKIEQEMEKMQEEIERLNELTTRLTKALRNLEIATQGGSYIKPDAETWESIKKGMTAQEVRDMLGSPEEITQLFRGGEVWYYYSLGSITFDRNGKVSSQKTFKELPIENKVR
jgi:TolA-binding protein